MLILHALFLSIFYYKINKKKFFYYNYQFFYEKCTM